jgi:hypothetical protein
MIHLLIQNRGGLCLESPSRTGHYIMIIVWTCQSKYNDCLAGKLVMRIEVAAVVEKYVIAACRDVFSLREGEGVAWIV